jgi:glycosyltransferase involved in cell wall biosynthesis
MTAVSVLLPVHNASRYVGAAVESILRQTHRDFEFLILDDGSRDDSLALLRRFEARDARVHVISRPNTGIVGALNELVALAKGEWLFRMDADDVARPQRFQRQLAYLDANPDCVALGSRALFMDPDGSPLLEFIDCFEHADIERTLMRPAIGILHPTVAISRRALLAVGGYREDYPHVEDLDLFLRLGEVGRLANLPEVLLDYRNHFTNVSHSNATEQSAAALRAVADACARRRIAVPALAPPASISESRLDLHRKWTWWALSGGYRRTAGKHAMEVLKSAPLNGESWRLLGCVLRP